MGIMEKSLEARLASVQSRTGKSLDELFEILDASGLEDSTELRSRLQKEAAMEQKDADTVVHVYLEQGEGAPTTLEGQLDRIYSGARAELRPIHDAIMKELETFGDFEVSAKAAYVSLMRNGQFATVGPVADAAVEVGLRSPDLEATDRLREESPDGTPRYAVRISEPGEVDEELLRWMRTAFENAG